MSLGGLKIKRYDHIIKVMSVIEEISKLSKNGCDDTFLNYVCENMMRLNVN